MIITLTTDFGLADPFVGIMKGVLLSIAPDADLVDITHDVCSYDVLEAALILDSSYRYFPEGTTHVVVVDPGVGSPRRPIAAASNGHFFVAPDNGVLSCVLRPESMSSGASVYWITNDNLFRHPISRTFHGRDIFAPVAAHLAQGTPIESAGPRIADFVMKPMPEPQRRDEKLISTVLRVDKFGNIITNLKREDLGSNFSIRIGRHSIQRLYSNFSEADSDELFAFEGSTGYIELALNQGSASERLAVKAGAEIEVETGLVNH